MTRRELEHVLRAAGAITGSDRFVVVGSQAVLGQFPDAPRPLTASVEADLYDPTNAANSDLIDGSIGADSPFHRTFGYHAHGVGADTATFPPGWESRCIEVRSPATGGVTGVCPEAHDLVVSKLVAGRAQDAGYVQAMLAHGLVRLALVRERLAATEMDERVRARAASILTRAGAG